MEKKVRVVESTENWDLDGMRPEVTGNDVELLERNACHTTWPRKIPTVQILHTSCIDALYMFGLTLIHNTLFLHVTHKIPTRSSVNATN